MSHTRFYSQSQRERLTSIQQDMPVSDLRFDKCKDVPLHQVVGRESKSDIKVANPA